ncbi:hypothetical protein KUCAC02_005734 [Chaenocephalus aceratus]|uniref:Uncharacterized protein n=1 Tax=Chaenocephalus aceratus TaxID=36190 RepID=A0ACB9WPF5_CHAAC|nr:hypothetical protein KUCAC02_005734 [Chaenocephalus aceratus]
MRRSIKDLEGRGGTGAASAAPVTSPLTPSVIRLSHQLIKPREFTPLAMLGPAASPQCLARPRVSGKAAGFTGTERTRASDLC